MKTTLRTVLYLLASATYALASGGAEVESLGFMATLFIAFGVLIVMFQFIPGIILLVGMIKGILSPNDKKVTTAN